MHTALIERPTMLNDMEAVHRHIIGRRSANRSLPPYRAALTDEIVEILSTFFAKERPGAAVSGVRRVGGGASKEQFFFTLSEGGEEEKFLLRMDPRSAITETDREREFILIGAMQGRVPVPEPVWIDNDAKHFPQSAAILRVVSGVTKPSDAGVKVSGLGTWLGPDLRAKIKDQFLDHLVEIHRYDFRANPLPGFEVPDADPKQAARWAYNYWRELWDVDEGEARPIMALASQWLADNMPDTADLVMLHGDYRTGNYLFDEESGEITALLDWELARIGDYHEDLGWVLMEIFGAFDPDGTFRASDLFEREEFIGEYERRSGRSVNRRTLHYYDVMSSWKCNVIVAANGLAAARSQHNHQDVLLTFLAAAAPMFANDLVRLLSKGAPA
ncbi:MULTISPECIES: phosphotransferase family protein [Sphingopyxis]|nr:phosphotransferase family protein [Sphingopyxis macrogoltabida]